MSCAIVAKVEWHPGELYPRVAAPIVTNLTVQLLAERVMSPSTISRGLCAEQYIKEVRQERRTQMDAA